MGNLARQRGRLAGYARPQGHRGHVVRRRRLAHWASALAGALVLAAYVAGVGVVATGAPVEPPPVAEAARVAAPVVRWYRPAPPAVVAAGRVLTVHGAGFGSVPGQVTVCQFCGSPSAVSAVADVLEWTSTVVSVVMPGMQNGAAQVMLTTADGRTARVGTVYTGVGPTGPALVPRPSSAPGPPSLRAVFLSSPPSPDGSMPSGLTVGLSGAGLRPTLVGDSVTVRTTGGQLLGLATLGGANRDASVDSWTPWQVVISLGQQWSSDAHLVVAVKTRYGSAAWTVGLPSGAWGPFLVWGVKPAVAAEYFPPGRPKRSLAALDAEAAQGRFPTSAAAAEHALPGGVPDPVQLWPVAGAGDWSLWQPLHLVDGKVPAGEYLVYEGRSFPDPLVGRFEWVTLRAAIGGPTAFWHAAVLQVLGRCRAPVGRAACS
ncbi:MAG: IPT/TIG domain-containing protein [Acidimicrobiales bacterium]